MITYLSNSYEIKLLDYAGNIVAYCNVNTRHLTAFIAEKGNLPAAYKLLGQIQEMQQQPSLEAYKRSLDLDSSQSDVLLKGFPC